MKEGFALFLLGWLAGSVVFFGITVPLGGTAQNGKVEDGHFFIGQHAVYREVSRTGYVVSAVTTWIWVVYGLALFIYGIFQRPEKRSHWALSLLLRILLITLAGGILFAITYESYRCLMQAAGRA